MIIIKLKETMISKNFNIGTLAEKAGMHRNGISKILNGKNSGIEYETLNKLCIALNCGVNDIIEFVKDEENN
ncbi:helix-turn-helix domain-containing protein [Psychrobacillus psychrodurans]|uniref:helix-turn-helix domain-containing protein n=1 Tax=Psychrobacillus psychrodurans TaxID=126157 RepID=UPI001F4E30E1|nr:helix-turn-helix domain-containing protein [Psychrobacillus psychrodurans]MCK1997952.1 helix-turn-helix domain-containing protein [Psychrobacillus psychrodurans]